MEYYLGLGKGMDDDMRGGVDSEGDSCGDDSEVSDKCGVERRLIRPQIRPNQPQVIIPRERKEESLMTIMRYQPSQDVANTTLMPNKDHEKGEDDSSSDEQKKQQERELTEELLRLEIPLHHLGAGAEPPFKFAATLPTEDEVLRQLEVIRKKTADAKRLDVLSSDNNNSGDDEYQVSDFVRGEWKSLAKFNARINPAGA